ncbi:MAG: 16S rRNA (cytidine1402-2'-O)-methyltransferase [Candidatus Paceibacteria bacterium]|jgi:16S rRNA (cytidine1402-2'-O)-methyltransferase
MTGTLYIVGTPIGNLGDITYRAVETLKKVSIVACEDTRVTRKLLSHFEISVPTISYNAHATDKNTNKIIDTLIAGDDIALVSDAGMPTISDPGVMLVHLIYNRNDGLEEDEQIKIESIPGPTALSSAISLSGISAAKFTFLGFIPHKKGRQTILKKVAENEDTHVFYESPHRLKKALESLAEYNPNRYVVVAKELTKIHEQVVRGTAEEVLTYFTENEDRVRGEFVILTGEKLK